VKASVRELLFTEAAIDKLGARGISEADARMLPRNRHVVARSSSVRRGRRLLVGHDDGGRVLTLIVEPTLEPTTWLAVTGWEATPLERRMVRSR
jgi:hypothetical protein